MGIHSTNGILLIPIENGSTRMGFMLAADEPSPMRSADHTLASLNHNQVPSAILTAIWTRLHCEAVVRQEVTSKQLKRVLQPIGSIRLGDLLEVKCWQFTSTFATR